MILHCFLPDKPTLDKSFRTFKSSTKRPGKLTKGYCFTRTMLLHTRLWLQWLLCVTVALNWLIDHPPYSPDLAPSDYFLFPNMKNHLARKQYQTNNEVISAVEDFVEDQDESFYTTGIQALQS